MDEITNECYKWWQTETYDNLLPEQKVHSEKVNNFDTDSGISASDYRIADEEMPSKVEMRQRNIQTPLIVINKDENVNNIQMAKIESYFERILTPEGNVKYKNYRILAPVPPALRMYSPSGDIHTTPKKGKVVPKFDIFNESLFPRERLLALIEKEYFFGSMELEAIIKPPGLSRRAAELVRNTNKSSMDDRLEFLSSVFSPSPSSLSILSQDSVFIDRYTTPSPTLICESQKNKALFKSHSIDVEDQPQKPYCLQRQISIQCPGQNAGRHMNLSDELQQADICFSRSYTPRNMTDFEYTYFHRPSSSLLSKRENVASKSQNPRESKKAAIRNFIQSNMIERASHREKLAKLALTIEEDQESEEFAFLSSAKLLESKIDSMLDEVKELRSELAEMQDDFHDDERRVTTLIYEARSLVVELRALNYLEDIISLLKGDLETVAAHKKWPFAAALGGRPRDPDVNLIV